VFAAIHGIADTGLYAALDILDVIRIPAPAAKSAASPASNVRRWREGTNQEFLPPPAK